MRSADFERLVEEAIATIPPDFRARMENIVITVEEEPTDDDLDDVEIDDDSELFGIFRGVPLTEVSFGALPDLPNQVAIFRGPILRCCRNRAEAVQEIRETVIHEIGHYFGLSDEEMPF